MIVFNWLLPAAVTVLAVSAPPAIAQDASAAEEQDRSAWVKSVQDDNFFFWERYAYRLTREDEFDLDEWWYQPNEIVDGALSAPLVRLPRSKRSVSSAAWAEASKYAFEHNTTMLAVVRKGHVEYERWADGHAPGTMEKAHSFSKTLVALLTGIAISEGNISSVDDPVGRYLSEWKDDPRGKITIRDLLQGTGGLEKMGFGLNPANKMLRLAEDRDVNAAALNFAIADPPGTKFSYNSVDTQIVGLVIERATGQRYTKYLSSRLWVPLGNGPATLNVDANRNARAFCCLRSLAEDWLRIGQMMLDKGKWQGKQIVPAAWIKEMAKPSHINPYFGLQLSIGRTDTNPVDKARTALMVHPQRVPYKANDVIFLTGANYVNLWIVPSKDLVILRLGKFHPEYDTPVIVNAILSGIR